MPCTTRKTALLAALLLAGCGGSSGGSSSVSFALRSSAIVVDSDAPFTREPDFPARVESTIQAALAYWGGDWKHLDGSTITFTSARHVTCGGSTSAVGCYDGDIRVSTRDAGVTFGCVEETALVHEVGHAVIGDTGHKDPRWLDFDAVARALAGRPGYGSGDATCAIYVSVWRHPPDPM